MIVSAAGRFDNAPAHIIIVSKYNSVSVEKYYPSTKTDEEREAEAEARKIAADIRRAERLALKEIERDKKAMARAEKKAAEKKMREERSAYLKSLVVPKPSKIIGPMLDTRPIKEPRSPRIRHRSKKEQPKHSPGYIPIKEAAVGLKIPTIIIAIQAGRIKAEKVQRQWFVNAESAAEYIASSKARHIENARASLVKARKIRSDPRRSCRRLPGGRD